MSIFLRFMLNARHCSTIYQDKKRYYARHWNVSLSKRYYARHWKGHCQNVGTKFRKTKKILTYFIQLI